MRYLRTNTACRITVGPFFDKTDGVTPEIAITVTGCKLTLMVDDANVPTLILDAAPTASGGANDMVHVTGDDAGFYDLELAAANVNYLGRAMLAITDAATHCPVFHEFMIVPAVVYDAMILGTDLLDTSMTQILGTAVSTPATAGVLDTNVKNINNVAAATPGAAGGIFIAGSNAATTVATLTVSGAVAFQSTFAVTTSTSLAALSCTTLTASGAVAFQSTFAVTTSTALAALSCTTLTASGAVAFQSTFIVTGATTLTGAVTASNASNNIVGIDVAKWKGTVIVTPNVTGVPIVDIEYVGGDTITVAAGVPDVNVLSVSGDTGVADNLEVIFENAAVVANFKRHYDGSGFGDVLVSTTIAAYTDQQNFTLTDGSNDNDAYNNCRIVIADASNVYQKAVGRVSAYAGATTKGITLLTDPAIWTPFAVGDRVTILAQTLVDTNLTYWRGTQPNALQSNRVDSYLGATGSVTVSANAVQLSGDATAADNAEAFFDGTGYAGTNNVIPVVSAVTGLTASNLDTTVSSRSTPAQVNAEVLDALATDTYAEPTGTPAATIPLATKISWVYMALRNRLDVSATAKTFFDDGGAAEWKKTLSDDDVTYSETEATTP